MTIKCGMLPTRRDGIYIKKGEVLKVRSRYRKVCKMLKNEGIKDRFVMYLISEGLSWPNSARGELYHGVSVFNVNNKKGFSYRERVKFAEILSIYDYLDEVTADSIDESDADKYVLIRNWSLFFKSWPAWILWSFIRFIFERLEDMSKR